MPKCDQHSHNAKYSLQCNIIQNDIQTIFVGIHLQELSWQNDTCASHHMINDPHYLYNYKTYHGKDIVQIGDGAKLLTHTLVRKLFILLHLLLV